MVFDREFSESQSTQILSKHIREKIKKKKAFSGLKSAYSY